jgi:transposase
MDMWNPYKTAVKTVLPKAKIVVDKFHVVKMANECLEKVRKELRSTLTSTQRKVLKNERYVLLKRRHDLTVHETINMEAWTKSFPILGEAYELKEAFYSIWDIDDKETAKVVLEAWVKSIPDSIKQAFEPLTTALSNWCDEVFNYYEFKATNAYTESLNSIIRQTDRIGRGYSFDVIRVKILYSRGIRKPSKPKYEDNLKRFDNVLYNNYDHIDEPITIYGGEDYGADMSTILQKLEDGEL